MFVTFLVLFLFSNKTLVYRAGIHNTLVRIANMENPDQTASADVMFECLDFFGRQLVLEIFEHLPY